MHGVNIAMIMVAGTQALMLAEKRENSVTESHWRGTEPDLGS